MMPKLTLSQGTIYFERHGEGEPVVALHDGAGSTRAWKRQVSEFAASFTFVTYDRLGHGQSEPYPCYTEKHFEHRAVELGELVAHLGFDAVHLCGICEGGAVAMVFAALWPEKTKTLICQGVGYYATDETVAECERYFRPWSDLDPKLRERLIDYHGRAHAAFHWESLREAKHYVWDRSYDLRPRFSSLNVPTLIMGGDRDPFFGLEHAIAAYKGIRTAELCIMPGAGHFLNEETPALFNSVIIDFLKRQITR